MQFFYYDEAVQQIELVNDAVDIIICPPAVDNLSDTDEIDEQPLHSSMSRDVPGTVELHHSDSDTDEAVDDDELCDQGNPTFTKFHGVACSSRSLK